MKLNRKISIPEEMSELVAKADKQILIRWASECAERVLHYYEELYPNDRRPHLALKSFKDYLNGKIRFKEFRKLILETHRIARETENLPARFAVRAVAQAVSVGHVKEHALGTAWYAAKAVFFKSRGTSRKSKKKSNGNWIDSKSSLEKPLRRNLDKNLRDFINCAVSFSNELNCTI